MEPHPHIPVLATSGLDHDVKLFSPIAPTPTDLSGLAEVGLYGIKGGGEGEEERGRERETELGTRRRESRGEEGGRGRERERERERKDFE